MSKTRKAAPIKLSIAIRAWNEEAVIRRTLKSFFQQSLFAELYQRGERCEIVCIPNGCTDRTAQIAEEVFAEQKVTHPFAAAFVCCVLEIEEAGRNHTWNAFVHELSSPRAEFLYLMDSDIIFDRRETLFNLYAALLKNSQAQIASDRPVKDVSLKAERTWRDRISLATTEMNGATTGRFSGQLYCIRAEAARQVYLPKDLGIDDGFIKALVCTDGFKQKLNPRRVITVANASHIYEAYTSTAELLNNQKRQMIGQTTVHVLVNYLKVLPLEQKSQLALTLRRKDEQNPEWVKQLVWEHLEQTRFFWRLFPDALTFRFERWWQMRGLKRLTHFPAAVAGFVLTLIACAQARRHFKGGQMHYWPKAMREGIQKLELPPVPQMP